MTAHAAAATPRTTMKSRTVVEELKIGLGRCIAILAVRFFSVLCVRILALMPLVTVFNFSF